MSNQPESFCLEPDVYYNEAGLYKFGFGAETIKNARARGLRFVRIGVASYYLGEWLIAYLQSQSKVNNGQEATSEAPEA